MAHLIPDTLDFSAYARATDARAKVRRASDFTEEMAERFVFKDKPKFSARMNSTSLRDKITFRPGEVTVWAGYNGHRKSMLTGQVVLDLCEMQERVLMASFEMAPGDTMARMAKQCFATSRPAGVSLEAFAIWTDDRLWLFDHVGRIKPPECLAVVRYFAEELQGTQVFIDSMMMVCASEESLDEQKQFMTDVVRSAQEYNLHVHVIAHCRKPQDETKPPTKYDLRGSAALSDQAHNVVTIWANKAKKAKLEKNPNDLEALDEADARVSIEKQRNGDWEGAVRLWFASESLRFSDRRTEMIYPYELRPLEIRE